MLSAHRQTESHQSCKVFVNSWLLVLQVAADDFKQPLWALQGDVTIF